MIETKTIMRCDLCGADVHDFDYRFVIKKELGWRDYFGKNKYFIKLDVCEDCINKICNAYKEKEDKNE